MPSDLSFERVALMSGEVVARPQAKRRQVLGYSEVASSETPLPVGLGPLSLLLARTGTLSVGERLAGPTTEPERLVAGSLAYVQAIASALPIDEEDERIVDALVAKRTANHPVRPIRRREGDPR